MKRSTAEAVFKAVQDKYEQWITMSREDFGQTDPGDFPQLQENWHGWSTGPHGKPTPFAIAWECNSPDDWALDWWNAQDEKLGVTCEPIFSFVLGIYDNYDIEWELVKRGSCFTHQRALTADRKPEKCWITKVTRTPGGAVDMVWYRHGDPKTGFLAKAEGAYFAESVISFWEA